MSWEQDLASSLARALGPLYRVSLVDQEGRRVASFGRIEGSRGRQSEVPLPGSAYSLVLELDLEALDRADEVLHMLAGSSELKHGPLEDFIRVDQTLEHLIARGEAYIGKAAGEMTRLEKQQLVRFLDERGAFSIRKAVEVVAQTLGVSRFTVYNYLESARDT